MVWVLTCRINDYDQYGNYLLAVFNNKPTFQELKKVMQDPDVVVGKTFRTGYCNVIGICEYYLNPLICGECYQSLEP